MGPMVLELERVSPKLIAGYKPFKNWKEAEELLQ